MPTSVICSKIFIISMQSRRKQIHSGGGHAFVVSTFVLFTLSALLIFANVRVTECASASTLRDECGHTFKRPSSFLGRHFDFHFLKKFFTHWVPFTSSEHVKMQFFLYKRDFPECGREIVTDDDISLEMSGFNAEHPTRIIIHGWMSQSKGSLNRDVKNAYLSLTQTPSVEPNLANIELQSANNSAEVNEEESKETNKVTRAEESVDEGDSAQQQTIEKDFNVVVVDWSVISSNVNYFGVVELVEDLGFQLAEFVRYLHKRASLHFDDIYLIGHSLGAQIAGSAGKQIQPFRFNTIYALDPAGPKFNDLPDEFRIDASDANYVESIQTSSSLGFKYPVGHATFYPNFGKDQKKCYFYGCSHSRAHDYFAESITSRKGFWGAECERKSNDVWIISDMGVEYRMGGEPSIPKNGTFYVKTNDKSPYALGRQRPAEQEYDELYATMNIN